jgi:hypothetical protein
LVVDISLRQGFTMLIQEECDSRNLVERSPPGHGPIRETTIEKTHDLVRHLTCPRMQARQDVEEAWRIEGGAIPRRGGDHAAELSRYHKGHAQKFDRLPPTLVKAFLEAPAIAILALQLTWPAAMQRQ